MKNKANYLLTKLRQAYGRNVWLFWFRSFVVVGVVLLFVLKRSFWTPDTLFIILLAVFVVLGQARSFLIRFLPFLALLVVYDSFRGIADDLNKYVHFYAMIVFDTAVFGALPTVTLQQWWWHGTVQWYDFYFYFLYTIHFLAPVLLGVLIWKKRESLYWPYVTALVGLSFAAFITYVAFPAAPPWMASERGMIPQITHISGNVWWAMGVTGFSEIYDKLSPNQVAAIPSLHSAYPMLFVLFAAHMFSWRRTWWLMFYPISIWVGVVYLGEHYVIDAILGALYAMTAYVVTMRLFAWQRRRGWPLKQRVLDTYQLLRGRILRHTVGEDAEI